MNFLTCVYQPISYGTEAGKSIGGHDDDLVEINDLRVLGLGLSNPGSQSKIPKVGGVSETALPSDASATLFVEGLPASCTRREVSRILYIAKYAILGYYSLWFVPLHEVSDIFRPFHGYKEVRVVRKEPKHVRVCLTLDFFLCICNVIVFILTMLLEINLCSLGEIHWFYAL